MAAFLATVTIGALGSELTAAGAADRSDFEGRAREKVAREHGIPINQLEVVERATAHLIHSRADLVDLKVQAPDGRLFGVSFDAASEDEVNAGAAQKNEARARSNALGKKDEALVRRLRARGNDRVPVAVWVTMADPSHETRGPNGSEIVKAKSAAAQAGVLNAVRAQGEDATGAEGVPVVFANLNAGQLRALESRDDVAAIYLTDGQASRMIDDSATSNRYPWSWPTANGTGIKVAVHEDDGVDNANTFLNNGTHAVTYWDSVNKQIEPHATNVAGVIASTNQWRRGGAYNASAILSANFHDYNNPANIVNSATWAVNQGAAVVNMSWGFCTGGSPNFHSRWMDYMQKVYAASFVVAAGNLPNCGGSTYVAAPGLAWNVTTAGSYWDKNTGLRSDDTFSSFTEWQNPTDPVSGRTYEKPDVTAAGGEIISGTCQGVHTTGVGSGVNASTCGTSFAAPDTAALIADIKQKIGTGSPEAAKAIVLASATHNIVDGLNYRDCPSAPVPYDCRDGAGAIDAKQAISGVTVPGNYRQRLISDGTNPAGTTIDDTASFTAGRKVRAAITWDSTAACTNATSGNCATDVLNADLDLQVLDPGGNVVASSASWQNSSEVIDFTAPVTGTYTIRTRVYRFDAGSTTFLGTAWNTNTADGVTALTGFTSMAPNTSVAGHTTDRGRSNWDNYSVAVGGATSCASFLSSETGLEKIYRVQTTTTGTLSASLSSIVGYSGVNSDVDVILLKASGAADSQNRQVLACGETSLSASSLPAGTYYVVVDGHSGSVAKYNLAVNFS